MFVTVKARVYTDATGVHTEIPALLTPAGVLEPLLDYCLARSHDRSLTWMSKVSRSVRMFLEYLQTNPAERDTYRLFQNFAQRLYTGTFDRETGLRPERPVLGAALAPGRGSHHHPPDRLLRLVGGNAPRGGQGESALCGGAFDRQADEAAYQYRRSRAFLGHTWAANAAPAETGHRVRSQRLPKVEKGEPPAFPEERFEELLVKGFRAAGRQDYRGMLITLLLHGAGFRESEPLHLYITDVFPDPATPRQALVRIHHPSYGAAPEDWRDERGQPRKGNRAEYLAQRFGLVPAHGAHGQPPRGLERRMHDGAYYKQAHWFVPEYGEWFLELWYRYLEQVARTERDHPFAFINLSRAPLGGMYGLGQYNKAHAAACERIGLTVGKVLGTTPHGHRHAYGRRLKNAGIEPALIRRFMHHASPESQEVYTQPNTREARAALEAAAQRLRGTQGWRPSNSGLLLPGIEPKD
ncbi:gamma-mobile-trio recombinase GmtY [Thauera humireducens]|uniref:gamma-mobile-trio recombinase GmtY n=1 Tax=Thauera humireducens TaxID=1134435 RepID=UPI00311F5AA5